MAAETTPKIEGYIEELTARKLAGWVWEVGQGHHLTVQVLSDGRAIGETVANRFRKDLLDGGKGNGKHAFEFAFPVPMADFARPGAVQVRVAGTARDLPWVDLLIQRLKRAPPLAPVAAVSAGRVHALAFADGMLAGRAELPDGRAALAIAIDDVPLGETDLVQAFGVQGPAPGPHPFTMAVPAALRDGAEHRITLLDAATGRRVDGGPTALIFPVAEPAVAAGPRAIIVTGVGGSSRVAWLEKLCSGGAGWTPAVVTLEIGDVAPREDAVLRQVSAAQLPVLVREAAALAREMDCAAVIVSPPTLGNLLLGNSIRRLRNCPLLVDVDSAAARLPAPDAAGLDELMRRHVAGAAPLDDDAWTPLAQALIGEADGVIVGNAALRHGFGGMVVRQGRDDSLFDPARCDRAALRVASGFGADDRVILMAGSAAGDGLAEVVAALARVAQPGLVLCIAGAVAEEAMMEVGAARVVRLAGEHRPEALAMADCVVVLQDAAEAVPEAVIDALAMDVPVLARPSEAIADLVVWGAVEPIEGEAALDAALVRLATAAPVDRRRRGAQAVYAGEFGREVNAARLAMALRGAVSRPPETQPQWQALLRVLRRMAGATLPAGAGAAEKPRPDLIVSTAGNDSDLDGGRADMIAKTLLAAGLVRRVVQFDRPISAARLEALAAGGEGDPHRGSLIYASTVRRVLTLADTADFTRRTFLHRSGRKAERLMGRDLPPAGEYPAFVAQALADAGVEAGGVLLVCAGADYAAVRKTAGAALMVVDLDDAAFVEVDVARWSAAVSEADVVVSGSKRLRARFAALRSDIEVVANAADGVGTWEQQVAAVWRVVEQAR